MPTSLPLSCLTMAPRADTLELYCNRKPLGEMNLNGYTDTGIIRELNSPVRKTKLAATEAQRVNLDIRQMLHTLREQLAVVLKSKPTKETASSTGQIDLASRSS